MQPVLLSDLQGHAEAHKGNMPHFHFQMRINGQPFIDYSDFHIAFTHYDQFSFAVENGAIKRMKSMRTFDAGMQDAFDQMESGDFSALGMVATDDVENAAFHSEIFIEADEGTTIAGDLLADLFEERKRTGTSMAHLAKKLPNVTVKTITSPGAGVPSIAARKSRKLKSKNPGDN